MSYEVISGVYPKSPPELVRVSSCVDVQAVNLKDAKDWCDEKLEEMKNLKTSEIMREDEY